MDNFNSSDVIDAEPVPAPRIHPRGGQAAVERMRTTAMEDRIESKRVVKSLTFGTHDHSCNHPASDVC